MTDEDHDDNDAARKTIAEVPDEEQPEPEQLDEPEGEDA